MENPNVMNPQPSLSKETQGGQTIPTRSKNHLTPVGVLILCCLGVAAVFVCSLCFGSSFIPLSDVFAYFFGSQDNQFILEDLRLPRTTGAAISGASLGISGFLLQRVFKNSLATPDVLGITKAGSLAVVFLMIYASSLNIEVTAPAVALASLVGSFLFAALLVIFALFISQPSTLIILGVALSGIIQAITSFLLVKSNNDLDQAMVWLAGSLQSVSMPQVNLTGLGYLLLLPLLLWASRYVRLLALPDDSMQSLGHNPTKLRGGILILAVIFAAGAVSLSGPVTFLGLFAPTVAQKICHRTNNIPTLLEVTAACGAIFLILADTLGRSLFSPNDVPAGIVTVVVGAPCLFFLFFKERKKNDLS